MGELREFLKTLFFRANFNIRVIRVEKSVRSANRGAGIIIPILL